jgi:hypothetical protein
MDTLITNSEIEALTKKHSHRLWLKHLNFYYNSQNTEYKMKFKNWSHDVKEMYDVLRKKDKTFKLSSSSANDYKGARPTFAKTKVSFNGIGENAGPTDFTVDLKMFFDYYAKTSYAGILSTVKEIAFFDDSGRYKVSREEWFGITFNTSNKKYEVLAMAAMIRIMEYFPDSIEIASELPETGWQKGLELVREVFGKGEIPFSKKAVEYREKIIFEEEIISQIIKQFSDN